MMIAPPLLSLLLAPVALAGPWRRDAGSTFKGQCVDNPTDFQIPSGLDPITKSPNLVLVGVGVQNYTCNANGTFDNTGAVAQLFDMSCLDNGTDSEEFQTIQCQALAAWTTISTSDPLDGQLVKAMNQQFNLNVSGQHYFQKSNGAAPVPVWDLRANLFKGNPNAFVVAKKIKTVPAPNPSTDVAWLELDKVTGDLATTVYRINTEGGQPQTSCKQNDTAVVKYSSVYLLN